MVDDLERYDALCAKVDAFVAGVEARHAQDMQCRPGCDGCCHVELSLTLVEAAAVRRLLAGLDVTARTELQDRAARGSDDERCPALDAQGRCGIYAARPLVCRSHGVPIRMPQRSGLPVISSCGLNFTRQGPHTVPPGDVLDQQLLSTMLLAVDAAYRRDGPGGPVRTAMAELLRGA